MDCNKSLSLPNRLELPHTSLSDSSRLVRLLCSVIGVPVSDMDGFRNQLSMRDTITSQFVRHDLPWFVTMTTQQTLEKPLRRCSIPFGLEIYRDHFSILIHSTSQIMLFAVDLDKYFIDVKGVTVASVLSLQPSGVFRPKLDTP